MLINKKKGFTILEVLFAIVILLFDSHKFSLKSAIAPSIFLTDFSNLSIFVSKSKSPFHSPFNYCST